MSVYMENHWKMGSHIPPFKVTQSHWNPHGSTGYLWLPINEPK